MPKRGEFRTKISTALAYQHYVAGLPLGTVIGEFAFCRNLTHEIARLMGNDELFTFVIHSTATRHAPQQSADPHVPNASTDDKTEDTFYPQIVRDPY